MKTKRQIFNPYLPSYEYIPDGEPHVFDNRLYIYGSHDRFNGDDYCVNDYVCWSAPVEDLSDFRYEGVIYKKSQHPYRVGRNIYFAPDVTKGKDGKYYLYYSVADSSIMSVAVSDTPAGSYTYLGDVHDSTGHVTGSAEGDFFQFDPGVFIDDDGRIFLLSGFCPGRLTDEFGRKYVGCHISELESDMLTIKSGPHIVIDRNDPCPEEQRYFEAPSLRKINNKYYLIYSVRAGGLHYQISDRPDGGYRYGGRIHSTSDVGINGHTVVNPVYPNGNTHGSIVQLNGEYYIFDHRLTNNTSYCRQGVAEKITIEADGSIPQVEATSCGLNNGPLRGMGTYPSYIACALMDKNNYESLDKKNCFMPYITQEGEDRECEPGQYIKNICKNTVIGYKYFSFESCRNVQLQLRGNARGTLYLKLTEEGNPVAAYPLKLSGEEWETVTMDFSVQSLKSGFYLSYEGEGSFDFLAFTFQQ